MAYTDEFKTYSIIPLNIKAGTLLVLFRNGGRAFSVWLWLPCEGSFSAPQLCFLSYICSKKRENIGVFPASIIHQKPWELGEVTGKEAYSLDDNYGKVRLAVLQIAREQFYYIDF